MVKVMQRMICGSEIRLMQQTLGRGRAHMWLFGVETTCLLGCGYKGLQLWIVWAQTKKPTGYLLCKWHLVAAGVCTVVWAVHSSSWHDLLHSSIIYWCKCAHQVWGHLDQVS